MGNYVWKGVISVIVQVFGVQNELWLCSGGRLEKLIKMELFAFKV